MAILKIHIALAGKNTKPRDYELSVEFVNPGTQLGDVYELSCPYLIHAGNSSVVRGQLKVNGELFGSEVACKMVEGDAVATLEAEATFYTTTLLDAQQYVVPGFILYATGVLPGNKLPYACMLTIYSGRAMTGRWVDNTIYNRYIAFLALVELHKFGVLHGDFKPSNIVIDDSGYARIIDFGDATLHKCQVVDRVYRLYEWEPSPADELRCDEVYDASLRMDLWTPVLLSFKGLTVNMKQVKSVADVVQIGFQYYPLTPKDQIRRQAHKFVKDYRDHYIARQKRAKAKLAELQATTATTNASSSESDSGLSSMTSSQSSVSA